MRPAPRRIAACILVVIGAAACRTPPGEAPPDQPHERGSAIVFASSQRDLEDGVLTDGADLATLRDLWVRVTLPRLPPVALLELEFVDPTGRVFYSDRAHYSADPATREIDVPELGRKVPVFTARAVEAGFALDRAIAIGGTLFQKYPTVDGTWQVRASIEGMTQPLTVPLRVASGH